jgi:hypothetical protein
METTSNDIKISAHFQLNVQQIRQRLLAMLKWFGLALDVVMLNTNLTNTSSTPHAPKGQQMTKSMPDAPKV